MRRTPSCLNARHALKFEVRILQTEIEIEPHVKDELFCIAREAITNSFRHANATEIGADVDYHLEGIMPRMKARVHCFRPRSHLLPVVVHTVQLVPVADLFGRGQIAAKILNSRRMTSPRMSSHFRDCDLQNPLFFSWTISTSLKPRFCGTRFVEAPVGRPDTAREETLRPRSNLRE